MSRTLPAALLALALLVPAPLAAETPASPPDAGVEGSCLTPPFSPEDQPIVDQEARDIAWILAGGRPVDPVHDGGVSTRWDEVPSHVLKWPEGTAIKVAYKYIHTGGDRKRNALPTIWRVGREPTGAHVKALVSRLRETTGLRLNLVDGWRLKSDYTINILALDEFVLEEWDPMGRDQERYHKYHFIRASKAFNELRCEVRVFYDDDYQLNYTYLTFAFERYADADISRCLIEGLAWNLGVPMWAPEDDASEVLGPFALIEALYDPRIAPGMTEAEVYPIVRDRLCAER